MCLYTDQLEPIVAEEDITVYKVIDDTNKSTCFQFQYEPNQTYILPEGFCIAQNKAVGIGCSRGIVMHGFHAYTSYNCAYWNWDVSSDKIVEMTIPKGSKVVYGDHCQVTSDTIRSGNLSDANKSKHENP